MLKKGVQGVFYFFSILFFTSVQKIERLKSVAKIAAIKSDRPERLFAFIKGVRMRLS